MVVEGVVRTPFPEGVIAADGHLRSVPKYGILLQFLPGMWTVNKVAAYHTSGAFWDKTAKFRNKTENKGKFR